MPVMLSTSPTLPGSVIGVELNAVASQIVIVWPYWSVTVLPPDFLARNVT